MLDFGVTRKVARLARERSGALSLPRGRRRGSTTRKPVVLRDRVPAAVQIAARIKAEQRPGGPPATLGLVAQRVRAVHEANMVADRAAFRDALVALGAAAGLVLDHHQALEAA